MPLPTPCVAWLAKPPSSKHTPFNLLQGTPCLLFMPLCGWTTPKPMC
jgi:hypothetical protein